MISYVYIFFVSEPNLFIVSCFVLNSDPVIFTAPLFIFGSGHVHNTSLYIRIRSYSQHLSLYLDPDPILSQICTHTQFGSGHIHSIARYIWIQILFYHKYVHIHNFLYIFIIMNVWHSISDVGLEIMRAGPLGVKMELW